jgi:dipeptidyl aminopeptidase/acylaminoacyl peptidase
MKYGALFLSALFCVFTSHAQEVKTIVPGSNLVIDGIPNIPQSVATNVKKYSESRSASFSGWHPVKNEMIISTRFSNTSQLHYVKMPMGDRKQITFFEEPVSSAVFEPITGKYFIYSKDIGGNEFAQLFRYDIVDGASTLISDGGRSQNGGVNWNNKKDLIAYTSTKRNGGDRDIYQMNPLDPKSDKLLFELKGGGWSISDWSNDDKKLLIREGISANESHLWIGDISTGKLEELTDRKEVGVVYNGGEFTNDGKGIWLITDKDNEFMRLAYMDVNSKKITYYTSDIKWDVEGATISEDGKHLVFAVNEAGVSVMYHFLTDTRTYKKIANIPVGVVGGYGFHQTTNKFAVAVSSAKTASDIYVVDLTSGKVERWTESEIGGLVESELNSPSLIKWISFDKKEISGFYYKAAAKFEGKRPVIINIHGGPEGQSRPGFFGSSNYYTNELGVAIIYPNVRGSSGYGKTFLKLDNGMKREESVQDIGALIEWIAKQPELDASRIMVMGGSYGGYMSLAVSTNYADKIKCAIDVVGISNFNTFLKNTETYRRDLRRVEYGDERVPEMAAFLEKISPLNNADKIKKPLFIIQGGNDPRVPRTEATQMKEKVKSNGGVVWYLEASDEGHGFKKKNNTDFQLYCMITFVKQYLLEENK